MREPKMAQNTQTSPMRQVRCVNYNRRAAPIACMSAAFALNANWHSVYAYT